MSEPSFIKTWIYPGDWPEGEERVGHYTGDIASTETVRFIPTSRECPYCHGPLDRIDRTTSPVLNRVVKVGSLFDGGLRQEAIVYRVPATVDVLRCVTCKQGFTAHLNQVEG